VSAPVDPLVRARPRLALWACVLVSAAVLGWALARPRPTTALPRAQAPLGVPLDAPALAAPVPAPDEGADDAVEPPPPGAEVSFERLEFPTYDPPALRPDPAPLTAADFPARARVLDGRRLRLTGFPLVTGGDGRTVGELLLTRYPPGCCFGALPVFDEWVHVTLAEPLRADDVPRRAAVEGVLAVGERLDELGEPLSLYRLRADSLRAR